MIQCRCGQQYPSDYPHCPVCGLDADHATTRGSAHSRSIYIILALLLGGLGVHNFYAGLNGRGMGQIALTTMGLFVSPLLWSVTFIWIIVDIVTVSTDGYGQSMS